MERAGLREGRTADSSLTSDSEGLAGKHLGGLGEALQTRNAVSPREQGGRAGAAAIASFCPTNLTVSHLEVCSICTRPFYGPDLLCCKAL